ncbi:NAD(P)-dependent dehydrogenase, short-chain alcohol dehydrogenase family [Parafrankia irregularis]|uniref:NAD(P)-dependent dehydrogenase, short-chain alcohol dehydrogenase family n=1 Tax=Parafrankia irregularis TaxID=795642 RepID=A0A0S4QY96_9ACTN|nr:MULTISPECIES: SDR family oxidoreductase [Parafrankia]MBE3202818.1 SDR family oxidoreductase [Parafrankia sp. CH37]CUU60018.1 NAD(P)-dependent dehydrogenase, short-chain alcohol dehydrogenase family [Parafrankia irregularis]
MTTQGRLGGKVAVVTGAGSTPGPGMATGRGCAILLAREGARVVLADIDPDRATETKKIIEGEGGEAVTFAGDMTKAADCEAMVATAVDTFGTVDVLVNNIGVSTAGTVVDTSEADWDRVQALSLRTMFLASKSAVPVMAARGSGSIVNIGSIAGVRGGGYASYAAAKGGMHALTVDMAYAHGRQGIRVNAIAPGHITTPLLFSVVGVTPEADYRQRMAAASTMLGTGGDGWDVGWAAVFLASDEARWITGVVLPVDGGVMAVTPLMMADHLRAVQPPPPA